MRLGLEVALENLSPQPILVNPFYAQLRDEASYAYAFTLAGCQPVLDAGLIPPGKTLTGWLSFDVPLRARDLELRYSPLLSDGSRDAVVRFQLGDASQLSHGKPAASSSPSL